MNPSESTTLEDPQEFVDEVNDIMMVIRVADTEKAELASYYVKDVA